MRISPILVLLTGCAATAPLPPGAPTAARIAAAAGAVASTGLSAADYTSYGIALAGADCADYFTSQVAGSQQSAFGSQVLNILGAAAGATGTPAGAGGAAAASMIAGILGSAQSNLGVGTSPAMVWGLVRRMQVAWLGAMQTPLSDADAFALVQSFADQCSLPNIVLAVQTAISSAPVVATVLPVTEARGDRIVRRRVWRAAETTIDSTQEKAAREWRAIQEKGRAAVENPNGFPERVPLPNVTVGPPITLVPAEPPPVRKGFR